MHASAGLCLGQPALGLEYVIFGGADVARPPEADPPDLGDQFLERLHPAQVSLESP